jgi:hypothetical protein
MTYVALLYSPQLDQFETDCNNLCYCAADLAEWVGALANHYNHYFGVDDFYIISINKMGE